MNIFGRLTRKTMKKNRIRTLVTIIGVILSTAMFTAVTTFVSSMMNFGLRTYQYNAGDWHLQIFNQDETKIQTIKNDKRVIKSGVSERIGFFDVNSSNDSKPYLYLEAEDEGAMNLLPIHITAGRKPISESELILPNHLLDNGGVSYAIGDTVTMEIGDRYNEEGAISGNGAYEEGESLSIKETKEYTIVGFYERPDFEHYQAAGYTAITCKEDETYDMSVMTVRVKLQNPEFQLDKFMQEYDIKQEVNQNWDVLMFSGIFKYNNIGGFVFTMGGIIVLIIMLGSISMIYSVFSISVSERTKQFGLLSSIGATKRQIKHCVYSEAATVLLIGVPIGLLSGILGMGVTFALVGDKFKSLISSPYGMELHVSVLSLVIAAVIASITVFISALVPSKRATKVSAMEAIRQSKEISEKKQKLKIPGFVYRLFGLEGMLANKYFKRSKRKYRTTVISLTLSIVLFVSTSVFCSGLTSSVSGTLNVRNFDIFYDSDLRTQEEIDIFDAKLSELPGVEKFTRSANTGKVVFGYEQYMTSDFKDYMVSFFEDDEETKEKESSAVVGLYYLSEAEYKSLAKEYGISEEEMNSDNPPALVLNGIDYVVYEKKDNGNYDRVTHSISCLSSKVKQLPLTSVQYEELENGEELETRVEKTVSIGAIINEELFGIESMGYTGPLLLLPETKPLFEEKLTEQYYFKVSDYEKMLEAFEKLLADNGYASEEWRVYDVLSREKDNRDIILLANVFSYGFITLLSLISVANVFNTISTNIALRRKDFGMLRSIGMTNKGLKKMMNYECLLYGSRALVFGIPLSIGMAYLIYLGVTEAVVSKFTLPFIPLFIAAFSVFAVVFTTMLYAMNKIKKDNPMEALRSESV